VRLRQSLYLNTNTRTGYWQSNTRTTKTEILMFPNLGFFVCVFVCFASCLFAHLSPLIFLVFCFVFVVLFC
jgi:hypothetical protein